MKVPREPNLISEKWEAKNDFRASRRQINTTHLYALLSAAWNWNWTPFSKSWICHCTVLVGLTHPISWLCLLQPPGDYLPFLTLGTTAGVARQSLPVVDDGASESISIPGGFHFGRTSKTAVHVSILLRWYWFWQANIASVCQYSVLYCIRSTQLTVHKIESNYAT